MDNVGTELTECHPLFSFWLLIAPPTRYGSIVCTTLQFTWPWFRKQTLAGKGFIVSSFTIFGVRQASCWNPSLYMLIGSSARDLGRPLPDIL